MNEDWIYVIGNAKQEAYAPKTKADLVYMDELEGRTLKEEIHRNAPCHFVAQLSANAWSAKAPYTQTVAVNSLLEADELFADVVLNDTAAIAINELKAYGCVSCMEAGNGTLTTYCYAQKPTVDLTFQAKAVR